MGFIQIPHLSVSLTFINWIPQNNCTEEESEWLAWKREVRERGGGRGGEVIQIKELQSISVPLFGLTSMKTLVDYTIYYVTLDWDQSLPNQALRKIWIGSHCGANLVRVGVVSSSQSMVPWWQYSDTVNTRLDMILWSCVINTFPVFTNMGIYSTTKSL